MRFLLRWLLLLLLTVGSHQANDSSSRYLRGNASWRSESLATHTLTLNAKVAKSGLQSRVPRQQHQPQAPIQRICRLSSKTLCLPKKPQQFTSPLQLPRQQVDSLSWGTQPKWKPSCLPKHFCQSKEPRVSHQPGSPLRLPGFLSQWPQWPDRPLYQLQRPHYPAKWPLYSLQMPQYHAKWPHFLPYYQSKSPHYMTVLPIYRGKVIGLPSKATSVSPAGTEGGANVIATQRDQWAWYVGKRLMR
ncbi:uncharacterized protein LOC116322162 isoform X2 [Oreochromis aureus]|uniref:uncharacterized protein LOC116322162 isoform X2 n=1 Tax=Oreochromis aureus TaxID=47969 RepID=UPI0012BBFC13|nr:uncharacterized protein LOC116322162 isoform X2 [Oreochromis aureus]